MAERVDKELDELKEIIGLANMGGFFEDSIKKSLKSKFNLNVIDRVSKQVAYDERLIKILSRVDREYSRIEKYSVYGREVFEEEDATEEDTTEEDATEEDITEQDFGKIKFDPRGSFSSWYLDKSTEFWKERVEKQEEPFWKSWDIPSVLKGRLIKLSIVDEKVYYHLLGVDGEKSVSEISKLPEFKCDEEYIKAIANFMEGLSILNKKKIERFIKKEEKHV